jgi:hypothetical protein
VPVTSAAGVPGPARGVPDPNAGLAGSGAGRERPQAAREPVPAAEIAALTTRLVLLGHGAELAAADQAELAATVLAQVEAGLVLRRYPLRNSDEPMLGAGPEPGWAR